MLVLVCVRGVFLTDYCLQTTSFKSLRGEPTLYLLAAHRSAMPRHLGLTVANKSLRHNRHATHARYALCILRCSLRCNAVLTGFAFQVRCDAASLGVPCTNCVAFSIECKIPPPKRKKAHGKGKDSDR